MASTRPTRPISALILDETRVLGRLIDDLRTLALSEAGHARPPSASRPTRTSSSPTSSARSSRPRRPPGCTLDRRHRRRPADHRDRPGPDPRGPRQPRRERAAPHAGRWPGHGRRGGRRRSLGPPRGPRHRRRDRSGAPPPRLRPVREGRRLARLRAGARHRAPARARARRRDRGRVRSSGDGTTIRVRLPAYGRVIRTSSTAASTVLARPRSAAAKTIRTVCPAHGVIGIVAVAQAGRSVFAAPSSWRTSVRTPLASST